VGRRMVGRAGERVWCGNDAERPRATARPTAMQQGGSSRCAAPIPSPAPLLLHPPRPPPPAPCTRRPRRRQPSPAAERSRARPRTRPGAGAATHPARVSGAGPGVPLKWAWHAGCGRGTVGAGVARWVWAWHGVAWLLYTAWSVAGAASVGSDAGLQLHHPAFPSLPVHAPMRASPCCAGKRRSGAQRGSPGPSPGPPRRRRRRSPRRRPPPSPRRLSCPFCCRRGCSHAARVAAPGSRSKCADDVMMIP
jgi:hypothetical protein